MSDNETPISPGARAVVALAASRFGDAVVPYLETVYQRGVLDGIVRTGRVIREEIDRAIDCEKEAGALFERLAKGARP
jgi:hypothetical protein